jgi:hypothetical protein
MWDEKATKAFSLYKYHMQNGDIRLNPVTGEVEVYFEGTWDKQ